MKICAKLQIFDANLLWISSQSAISRLGWWHGIFVKVQGGRCETDHSNN